MRKAAIESILRSRSELGEDEGEDREAGDSRVEEEEAGGGGGDDRLNRADTEMGWAETGGVVVAGSELDEARGVVVGEGSREGEVELEGGAGEWAEVEPEAGGRVGEWGLDSEVGRDVGREPRRREE